MLKLFISHPVNGLSNYQIIQMRSRILEKVRKDYGDVQLLNTYYPDIPEGESPLKPLGMAIETMADADIVYFTESWRDYRGCRIEHDCAVAYGKRIIKE